MEFNLNQQKTNQLKTSHQKIRPRPILKRITALLLVLLFTATTLSPTITALAEETNETENDARTMHVTYKSTQDGEVVIDSFRDFYFYGEGRLVVRSYFAYPDSTYSAYYVGFIAFSDKPMDYEDTMTDHYINKDKVAVNDTSGSFELSDDGTFYYHHFGVAYYREEPIFTGLPNLKYFSSYDSVLDWIADITSNNPPDLTKDDYVTDEDIDESTAIYNKDLDFSTISADYKTKYTIEKDNDGHWNFITPDEAGIQFDWTNRTDIDGAYVRFNVYGEYYDSFWSTSYTNTYVTLTCERKNDLTYLCNQKQMISLAKEKCNGSKGYGFVVNYIYVQAFAKIDGTLYRSRIYKFNSGLVSDYGNADDEDDEWVPEVTGGDSMPEDYEPDPDNPDPEKTEPAPDKDDDTVIDYPVEDNPDVIINDDTTYLEAFKQFINVMKQGIAYLGDFPSLINSVFSFIPSIFLVFIGVGFAVALVLRFLGR